MVLIYRWKTRGALVRPKGILKYSNWPKGVTNEVYLMDDSAILT